MKQVLKLLAVYYYTILIVALTLFLTSCSVTKYNKSNIMQCTERRVK